MTERGAWGETERGLEPQTTERSETCRVPVAFPARPTVTRNRMNNGMFTRNQRLLGDQEVLCRRCSSESCASAPAWWDAMKERPNSVEGRNTMSRMSQCRWDVLCLPVVSDLIHYILPTWNQFTSFFPYCNASLCSFRYEQQIIRRQKCCVVVHFRSVLQAISVTWRRQCTWHSVLDMQCLVVARIVYKLAMGCQWDGSVGASVLIRARCSTRPIS